MAVASRYGTPPFDVSQGGGVFTSRLVERGTDEDRRVLELNRKVLTSLGLVRGVSHSEYIRRRERRVRVPRDLGPGWRRTHQRAGRGGDRGEPVVGVGAHREGGRG